MKAETYYQTLQQGLRALQNTLPEQLEPSEKQALRERISRICSLAACQVEEIRVYDRRYRDSQ